MNGKDLLLLGLRNLLRRKTRTLLAVIGVVVGTCAIIVMLSIGFGMSANFEEQIASYGDLHLVNVYGGGMYGPIIDTGDGQPAQLDDKAIAAFEKIKGVEAATPRLEEYMTIAIGKYVAQVGIVGMRPEVMQKFGYELQEGRLLQPGDKFNLVFGNQVPSWFYNPKKTMYSSWDGEAKVDVITDKIIITGDYEYGQKRRYSTEDIDYKTYKAKGVGLLANPNNETAYYVYTDLDSMKEIQADLRKARKEPAVNQLTYNNAMVYVGDINDVQDVSDAIREMGFQTSSLNDWLEAMQEQSRMIQGVLGGIGAISLFVASPGHYQYHDYVHLRAYQGNRRHEGYRREPAGYTQDVSAGGRAHRVYRRSSRRDFELYHLPPVKYRIGRRARRISRLDDGRRFQYLHHSLVDSHRRIALCYCYRPHCRLLPRKARHASVGPGKPAQRIKNYLTYAAKVSILFTALCAKSTSPEISTL
jgi:putative ABC transport system permease protein